MIFLIGIGVGIITSLGGLVLVACLTLLISDHRQWNQGKCKEHKSYWRFIHKTPELKDSLYYCGKNQCAIKLIRYRKTRILTSDEIFKETIK